jgi:hypothetical protein
MQDGDSVPVCFGMMHLMQKFSREKSRRSPAKGEGPQCAVPVGAEDSSCTTAPNDSGTEPQKQYEALRQDEPSGNATPTLQNVTLTAYSLLVAGTKERKGGRAHGEEGLGGWMVDGMADVCGCDGWA